MRLSWTVPRFLMVAAAAAVGLATNFYALLPFLAQIGRGVDWRTAAIMLGLLTSFGLFTLAVISPRSVIAAVGSALPVSLLLIWGMGATPMSWPRLPLHLAAILCLAATLIQVGQRIVDRRFGMLWTLAALLLGFPIGFVVGGLIGLHIWLQYCQLPLIGAAVSSILCSG
jgi:hypothetical protein